VKYKIAPKEPVQLTLKMVTQDAETLREFEQTGNPVVFDAEVGGS
jgi:hypothetical protein